jgi:gluconokinase
VNAAIVVMGVSGAGKSTLGCALATALGCRFVEGDTLHPAANVAKMAAGIPLDDNDREPYLERVAQVCAAGAAAGVVVSCSALKRRYRDVIRKHAPTTRFVLPLLDHAQLAERLNRRRNHFMPASLLDSQLAALEPPAADEHVILVDGASGTSLQVALALASLAPMRP